MADNVQVTDYSLVTAILRKGTANKTVNAALSAGVRTATITTARGTVLRSGFFLRPTISPEQEIAQMLVPNDIVDNVLAAFVEEGYLYVSGAGAVYSAPVGKAIFNPEDPILKPKEAREVKAEHELHRNLVSVTCILQQGMAEDVARSAVELGAPGPTIYFGQGKGLRQKLGLLRIAVSPEKELLECVVGHFDSDKIFEEMVDRGKLGTPGMGFIYTKPVDRGLINIAGTEASSRQAASVEQMIKAIDDIKAGTEWRSHGSVEVPRAKKRVFLKDLENIICVIERDKGEPVVKAAMAAGAPGATISYAREIGGAKRTGVSGREVSSEKEVIQLIVAKDKAEKITEAMLGAGALGGEEPGYIYTLEVDKALTYLGPGSE